jgi:sterol desaturase/sphingolipid hydroxylase (fatty acid hydroxylase superfamily)
MEIEGKDWSWVLPTKNAIVAFLLVALWVAESIAPMFAGRLRRLSHGAANLVLGVTNSILGGVLFGVALLLVTKWSQENSVGLLHRLPRHWPAWVSFGLGLLLTDLWMYVWHRLNHQIPLLWRFHAVHHSDREMDVTTAVRFHTGEIVFSGIARLLVLPVLGVSLPILLVYELLLLPVILFHHSNLRIARFADGALRAIIVTPWMHWVHHSVLREETNSNYGSVLSIWDRLFGSFRVRAEPSQIELGLSEDASEQSWRTLFGMFLRPFK